ncbi:MAG TPA: hypothetical protein VGF69_02930 [Thermoanaerobaculia bacterium]|jgi:outer membrane protein assembly factor BamA
MKRIVLILLLTLFPLLVHAQPEPQPETFIIDRIDVAAGTRVPVQIVRSELRLQQERAYSEADLRGAIARVRRLPFVFDASYRLEPSVTTPFRWTLIVEIIDIAPATFAVDAIADEEGHTRYDATLGGNVFLPGGHVVDASVVTGGFSEGGISAHSLRLSYTAYDLLDRPGAFAIISIDKTYLRNDESGQPDLGPSLTLGYPLTATQTLLFRAAQSGRRMEQELEDFDDPLVSDVASRFLELLWRRDTTDDPFFTRSGSLVTFGPSWTNNHFTGTFLLDDELEPFDRTSDAYALQATGSKYLPLGLRNTIFGRLRAHGTVERTREAESELSFRRDSHATEAILGMARNLTMTNRLHTRLELSAGLRHLATESLGPTTTSTTQQATATWMLRHRWTTVRVSVVYEWE